MVSALNYSLKLGLFCHDLQMTKDWDCAKVDPHMLISQTSATHQPNLCSLGCFTPLLAIHPSTPFNGGREGGGEGQQRKGEGDLPFPTSFLLQCTMCQLSKRTETHSVLAFVVSLRLLSKYKSILEITNPSMLCVWDHFHQDAHWRIRGKPGP